MARSKTSLRPRVPTKTVPVLIDPNATRRDADEPHVERPARILARNPDGSVQVAYVREGQFVVDPVCPVKREGWGCCWPTPENRESAGISGEPARA